MKKFLCGFFLLIILLSVSSCGTNSENLNSNSKDDIEQNTKTYATYPDYPDIPDFGALNNISPVPIEEDGLGYANCTQEMVDAYITALEESGFSKRLSYETENETYVLYTNQKHIVGFNATTKGEFVIIIKDEHKNSDKTNSSITLGEKNALQSAKQYLNAMPFSYSGLVEQLEYEGYSYSEAIYAVNNCEADWFKQAVLSARQYLNAMPFSRQELIDQLEYEGFTHEQAVYGVEQNGY